MLPFLPDFQNSMSVFIIILSVISGLHIRLVINTGWRSKNPQVFCISRIHTSQVFNVRHLGEIGLYSMISRLHTFSYLHIHTIDNYFFFLLHWGSGLLFYQPIICGSWRKKKLPYKYVLELRCLGRMEDMLTLPITHASFPNNMNVSHSALNSKQGCVTSPSLPCQLRFCYRYSEKQSAGPSKMKHDVNRLSWSLCNFLLQQLVRIKVDIN